MTSFTSRRRFHAFFGFLLLIVIYVFLTKERVPLSQPPLAAVSPDLPQAATPDSYIPPVAHDANSNLKQANLAPPVVAAVPAAIPPKDSEPTPVENDVEMVVASVKKDNVTWLGDYLKDWKKNIYVTDDKDAELTVEVNKGSEAMVFLTYLIDRYDSLPSFVIFHHANRFQWHNDNPDYDGLTLLQNIRFDYVKEQGYANLRCVWILGCPDEIKPIADAKTTQPGEGITAKRIYKKAFEELFPGQDVPEKVGVPCCSQFALSKEIILKRPKDDYIRFREWLLNTDLNDALSGRVFEHSWHIIFGKKSVHCPNAGSCYCKLYGFCKLKCGPRGCFGQYHLPPSSTLPDGWPKVGWEGEDRNWSGPE